jgi:soluble lytic murein transglycosylase-like protein
VSPGLAPLAWRLVVAFGGRVAAQAVDGRKARRRSRRRRKRRWRRRAVPLVLAAAVEVAALAGAGLIGVIGALGHFADWFAGAGLVHLLPFAGAVLGLGVTTAVVLRVWLLLRRRLARWLTPLPALLAVTVAAGAVWQAAQPAFDRELGSLRVLVGGSAEAERLAIAHQVYAAYRRADLEQMQHLLERARPYAPTVSAAAASFGVDAEVLMGVAAAESSFLPRSSNDGGRGLFQITAPPALALELARARLGVARLDLDDPRDNAFVAAATLGHYLGEMRGDLFLGLLAYNIGPRNGGLRAIMERYGARDFVTIQPYLQHLPRDYPVRVLAAALAYRVWRITGGLPRYEEGDNALRIQQLGIPGLQSAPPTWLHAAAW